MSRIKDITDYLDELFPKETAEDYDNPGLMTGKRDQKVTGVVLSLDATSGAIMKCKQTGSNLLLTHHPLIFGGIDTVCEEDTNGLLLSAMIRNDITCYAAHTNLDKNSEYSNFVLARKLGAVPESVRELEGTSCGAYFELPSAVALGEYMKTIRDALDCSGVISINNAGNTFRKVFVQGGAFDEDSIPSVRDSGAELVVSGEIKHHVTLLLAHMGILSVIAGHNATERVFVENLMTVLQEKFKDVPFYYDEGHEHNIDFMVK
ncbi:MAG: Nif3-like dinuclear metal center hexameric protein [Clostridiales bacterium]|nr:Nif3-like dinuclear metal center hexameric protein [Clostridiales bacterium]